MNESHQIEVVTGAANRIITSLQAAIFSTMEAAANNVECQVQAAAVFQRLESQEAILDWLISRRIAQEERLNDTDLRPAQKAMIQHKIASIDEQLSALLTSSGIDSGSAVKAVAAVVEQPRDGQGRFLPTSNGK